jgi:Putative bacterial sensory transduction regulator
MGFFRDLWRSKPEESDQVPARAADSDTTEDDDTRSDEQLKIDVEQVLSRELGASLIADTEPSLGLAPLARTLILDWLKDNNYYYFVDSDNDIGGLWNSRIFYFLLFGSSTEILQVRGQWNRNITIERIEEILDFCNEWNTDQLWPKAYLRVQDNGVVQVYGEVSVDFEHGLNRDQLDNTLSCGLGTASMLFDALDAKYPDPAQVTP